MDLTPIWISLKTACLSIVITFFLGLWAARLVAGRREGRLKIILDGIFVLPLVLPPTVAGFLLLYLFGVRRPIGWLLQELFGYRIVFTWQAAVLASVVISFPLMYRSARGALEGVDPNLVAAARTLGLSERRIFWRIKAPLAKNGLLSGTVIAFARGLGEFGATAMIAGNIAGETRTLPLAVYSKVAAGDMRQAGFYAALLASVALILLAGLNLAGLRSKEAGRFFRKKNGGAYRDRGASK